MLGGEFSVGANHQAQISTEYLCGDRFNKCLPAIGDWAAPWEHKASSVDLKGQKVLAPPACLLFHNG